MHFTIAHDARYLSTSVATLVVMVMVPLCCAETTTVYLVRHAEKKTDTSDSDLTVAGQKRAKDLARTLRSVKLDVCISSQFKRTQQTATPAAKAANLTLVKRKAGQEAELATEFKKDFVGKTILFVGHSDTVPTMLKNLGAKKVPSIGESDFDNLFLLRIRDDGVVIVTRLHYGEPNPR